MGENLLETKFNNLKKELGIISDSKTFENYKLDYSNPQAAAEGKEFNEDYVIASMREYLEN